MLHYEQIFGNVFERKKSKCYGVLVKHCRKVKGEQVTILQMAQQINQKYCCTRTTNLRSVLEETHCIDNQGKVQSVTGTDNEFTEWQAPTKKLSSQLAFHLPAYTRL